MYDRKVLTYDFKSYAILQWPIFLQLRSSASSPFSGGEENKEDAVKVFESNSAVHASSSNGWDSLAEGYEALGDVAWL